MRSLNIRNYLNRQQSFYLFLMIAAYLITLVFGSYYYILGIKELYLPTFAAFFLFVILGIVSFFSNNLVLLFRLSILTGTLAFINQVWFSGGILSPGIAEFIIPPLLAFFYRPVSDRFIFMGVCFLILIAFLPLTLLEYTELLLPPSSHATHAMMCGILVFIVVSIFTVLFRAAIVDKNKKLGSSMTQLRDTTQKLIHSEKMASLGMLSAGVAHEINNPLNFIQGGIEILERDLKRIRRNDENYLASFEVIKEGLSRASVIVNSLSHFSRQTDAMNEPCDLHAILDNSVIMLQHKLKYKGNLLKIYDDEPAIIQGNEGRLHQAFLNFISNAEEAIDEEGTIELHTEVNEDEVKVEIKDTGVGIRPEYLDKISDPFFTTKPVGEGTGLGLAISYRIIQDYGGRIRVQSQPGKGTCFTIKFRRI